MRQNSWKDRIEDLGFRIPESKALGMSGLISTRDSEYDIRNRSFHSLSSRAEESPHLEVAHGERCLLEQPRQLTFNDLGGPQRGSIVHDEDFFMAGQR
jgi:hypothetical protein